MATESSNPPAPSDGNPQNTGPELSKPVDGNGQDVKGEALNDNSERPIFASSQPMREDQVENAVKFLSHPRVRGSPVIYRRSFLEKKGLTKEEIDEAFRRVPDPPSNATTVEPATINQATQPKASTSLQPQSPIQAPQPGVAPASGVSMVPRLQQSRFQWSHALIAAGVLAASGAGTAVFFKNVVVPRLKTWIRKVVAEENESEKEDKSSLILTEQAAEAAKAAASAAAVVAQASQELINSKNEERKFFDAFMGMMDVQVKEMKSMGDAIRKLESTKENSYSQNKLVEEFVQSTMGNGTANNPWRTSQVNQPDASVSLMAPKQVKANGTPNFELGAARPSSAPATVEPLAEPAHPKSYMEIMAMIQRGEKPPNIKEIDDMPPNPNQQPSKPLLAPRPKPWEVSQQRPSYAIQSQPSNGSPVPPTEDIGIPAHSNGKSHDTSEPWWKRKSVKITEIEPGTEESKQQQPPFPYNYGGATQRGWVPPQPPTVAIPESAVAIRQPKSSAQQPQSSEVARSDDAGDGAVGAPDSVLVESEASGSGFMDSNQNEIEEERGVGVVEAN